MPRQRDLHGYYAALGVEPSATAEEIKKAFKQRARDLHPDRNSAPDATARFQFLNEAFQVLSDPESRARYDGESLGAAEAEYRQPRFDPIVCSVCGKISAQPRYAIYRRVVSFVVFTRRTVYQGIYCSECSATIAYKSSLMTWFLGWWGLPWGPFWSVGAILRNMLGGEQPAINNFKILVWQALYFVSIGRADIARPVALAAFAFKGKIAPSLRSGLPSIAQLSEAVEQVLSLGESAASLPRVWGFGSRAFNVQAIGAALIVTAIGTASVIAGSRPQIAYRHDPPTEVIDAGQVSEPAVHGYDPRGAAGQPPPRFVPDPPQSNAAFGQPIVQLPRSGVIRALWRRSPDVVAAPLKVVAPSQGPHYYIKLVSVRSQKPMLVLFVRSGETASVEIPIGDYEFRYAAGAQWYGEEYLFGPGTSYAKAEAILTFRTDGDDVLGHTIELEKQQNGNLPETALGPSQF